MDDHEVLQATVYEIMARIKTNPKYTQEDIYQALIAFRDYYRQVDRVCN